MSAPFFACPPSIWPRHVELLTASGMAWERDEAVADLRWHVDQGRALPGRPALAARWRWTDWAVRTLLADVGHWWDPTKGDAPSTREDLEARRQPSSSRRQLASNDRQPALEQTPTIEPIPPAPLQPPPADRQPPSTRALHSAPPSPSPPPVTEEQGALPPEPPCQVCGHIVARGCLHGIGPSEGVAEEVSPKKPKQTRKAKTIAPLASELWALLRTPEDDLHPSQRWSDAVMAYTRVPGRAEQDARDYAAWVLGSPKGEWCRLNIRLDTSLWAGKGAPGRLGEVRAWAGRQRPAAPAPRPTWAALLDRAWDLCPVEGVELEMVAAELAVEGGWPDLAPPEVAAEVAARARGPLLPLSSPSTPSPRPS